MAREKKSRNNRDKSKSKPLDKRGAQVLAFKTLHPDATIRQISGQLGISKTAVWRRIKGIEEADWFKKAIAQFQELIPLALANYAARIAAGDGVAAHDVTFGLGVLKNRHKHEHSGKIDHGMGADPLFAGMDAGEIEAMREACRNRIRAIEKSPPALGEDVPPDGEKRAD